MPFSDATNPKTFGDTDPLAAGIPPLYTDRIVDDGLPQPGSIDPLNEPAFTVIENPVIDASGTVSESPSIPETVEDVSPIDANLETLEMADDDPLIHADDPPIDLTSTDAEALPETDSDDEIIVGETDEVEATNNETSNTSQSEETEDETAIVEEVEATDNETSNTSQSEESDDETEKDAIADEVEATNNDSSNTSQSEESEDETEEDAIADDVDVAVDPIPEIDPVPLPELASGTSGIYTVGSNGTVLIDYNYDHGKFESEVAIVSTSGLEDFLPIDGDFSQFNAEVSRRALSDSEHGHIVIADATEGARFSNSKWGPDRNLGTYLGVKSFQMNPGDNFMVVMVPNRTFQETLDKSGTNRSQQLLFSVAELNPGGHVQFVQVAEGGADGNLFAFEDLRLDRNSDKSFNDIVLQMRGIEGQTPLLSDVVDITQGVWSKDMGQALIDYGDPYLSPAPIELPISLDEPLDDTEIEDLPSDGAGLNTTITRDDDTAEAGLESTIVREDEVVAEESTETEEEETVVDASTETEEEETVVEAPTDTEEEDTTTLPTEEDSSADDETVEASTGFAGVPTISTSPPEPYNFATKNQPTIVVIDTGFSGNNPDIEYENITSGTDFVTGDNNSFLSPGEGSEHGTHILGIIAATQNNGVGINGINDDAPIVAIRAIGSGRIAEAIIEGVDRIQASGQPNGIINLSLDLTQINPDGSITPRYELTPEEREAIEYARQHGVILAVAAGNDGGVMSVLGQASQEFDNIITVGAAERVNAEIAASKAFDRSDYSSFGRGLDIVAPGGTVDNPVLSTVEDGVGTMAGTSVATAKVTGAASQIWAANSGLNYRQVIEILKSTSTDLDTPNWDGETGFGLLNIDAAVKVAKVTAPEDYTPPVSFIPDTWGGEGIVTPGERAAANEFMGRYYEWYEYTIQPYDILSQLALDTMGSASETYYNFIADYNGIPDPDLIYAGDTILLPYEVEPPPQFPDIGDNDNLPYSVSGEFWNIYITEKGADGIFGNPISDRYAVNGGERQDFQGGAIIQSSHGTFPLFGGIGAHYLIAEGGEAGRLGFPTTKEIGVGNGVIVQKFENGQIVYGDGDTRTEMFDNPDPDPIGIVINGYTIEGSFYPVFQQYQVTLGNPLENVQTHPTGATYQRFDNGSIVSSEHGTFPLYGGIRQEYLNNSGLDGWLGEPTSGEVGQGNGFIKQTFENGYIIWNGSSAEAYQHETPPPTPFDTPPIIPNTGSSLLPSSANQAEPFFKLQYNNPIYNPSGPSGSWNCGPASLAMVIETLGLEPPGISIETSIDRARYLMNPDHPNVQIREGVQVLDNDFSLTYWSNLETGIRNAGGIPESLDGWENLDRSLAEGKPVISWGFLRQEWRNQFPERVGNGNVAHLNAILGKTSDGKYIVADPMHQGGPVEMTKEQLAVFYWQPDRGYYEPTFIAFAKS